MDRARVRSWIDGHYPPAVGAFLAGLAALIVALVCDLGDDQLWKSLAGSLAVLTFLLGALTLVVGALVRFRQSWQGAAAQGTISTWAHWLVLVGLTMAIVALVNVHEADRALYEEPGAMSSLPAPDPAGDPAAAPGVTAPAGSGVEDAPEE